MSTSSVFASYTAAIGQVETCAQLQDIVDRATATFIAQNNSLTAQMALLAPIAGLLTAPTNPSEVITFLGSFITDVLTPQYNAYLKMVTQAATLASDYATLTTAIGNAATRIGGGCSITVPPI